MYEYAHPEVLVSTDLVNEHLDDPNMVIAEVDVDTSSYEEGHIPGAIGWNWQTQLCDTKLRDIIGKSELEELLGRSGISNDSTDECSIFFALSATRLQISRENASS